MHTLIDTHYRPLLADDKNNDDDTLVQAPDDEDLETGDIEEGDGLQETEPLPEEEEEGDDE